MNKVFKYLRIYITFHFCLNLRCNAESVNSLSHDPISMKILLEKSGFMKVYTVYENPICTLFLVVYNENQYLVAVVKGERSIYSKVVPADTLIEIYWKCEYVIYYTPQGLYAFADNINDLVNKVIRIVKKYEKTFNREFSPNS